MEELPLGFGMDSRKTPAQWNIFQNRPVYG